MYPPSICAVCGYVPSVTGQMDTTIELHVRGELTDPELEALHAAAFDHPPTPTPWRRRLEERSLTWITARLGGRLVGFVNVIGDGGAHAILLDTCVAPDLHGRGVGRTIVEAAAGEAQSSGCEWLHADYEPRLVAFYEGACGMRHAACGMRHSKAGLLRLEHPVPMGNTATRTHRS